MSLASITVFATVTTIVPLAVNTVPAGTPVFDPPARDPAAVDGDVELVEVVGAGDTLTVETVLVDAAYVGLAEADSVAVRVALGLGDDGATEATTVVLSGRISTAAML
jgi:hypothetical protein